MGYMEEVFQRAERMFPDIEAQIGWLSSFKEKKGNAYEKAAVAVASNLQESLDITERAKSTDSLIELKELSYQANRLKFNRDLPLGTINDRIRILEGEAVEQANIFKEAASLREREEAEERLKELGLGRKIGGIKSGESRRGKGLSFRAVFGEI